MTANAQELIDQLEITSEDAVDDARQVYEDQLEADLSAAAEVFLRGVISDAVEALGAATLIAAGAQPLADLPERGDAGRFVADPFSFTQVMKRWYGAVRELAADTDLDDRQIRMVMDGADLPSWAFDEVSEALRTADTGRCRPSAARSTPASARSRRPDRESPGTTRSPGQ